MVQQTQTTVTTRTTEVPKASVPVANVIKKDAVITNVMEKPVVENVIEKKNVEVHHKNVVQEIHEQKIIEIEKKPVIQSVNQGTLVQQERAATKFEEIGSAQLSEQERLRLQQLNATHAPKITQASGAVKQVQEGEQITQVVRQELIEHHVQPVITEVREQNIVQEVVHPVVRKVHEAPIIREVTSTSAPLTTAPLVQSAPLTTTTTQSGLTTAKTTTVGSGVSSTTTTTSGVNPVQAEQRNLNIHEQKVMHKDGPLTNVERTNLATHEKVVDQVVKGNTTGLTNTHATTTTTGTHLEGEHKAGFMERVKDKLHLHRHHDTTTTHDRKL